MSVNGTLEPVQTLTGSASASPYIPERMAHKLTFTGAVSAEYDGSEAVSVEIPEGGNGSGEIADGSVTPAKTTFMEIGTMEVSGVANGVDLDITPCISAAISEYYGKWIDENETWFCPHYKETTPARVNGFSAGRIVTKAIAGKPYFRYPCKSGDQYFVINWTTIYGADSPDALTEEGHPVTACTKNDVVFFAGELPGGETDGGVAIISPVEDYPYYYISVGPTTYGSGRYARTNPTLVAAFDVSVLDDPFMPIESGATTQEYLKMRDEYLNGYYKNMFSSKEFAEIFKTYFAQMAPKVGLPHTFGKSLYIGGDSLHAYSGGDGATSAGFVTDYNKHFGFNVAKNDGYAGSTWSGTAGGGGIKRVTDLVAAGVPYDVFILAWGTNEDTGGNGTIEDEASNTDGCTMVAAMKWCITQLRTTFSYSAIGVIIPPPKNTNEGMKEKGDLMIEVCKLLHVPYVDMREYLSMDDMSSDGVHLGYGANKYGAAEAKLILDICPYGEPLS